MNLFETYFNRRSFYLFSKASMSHEPLIPMSYQVLLMNVFFTGLYSTCISTQCHVTYCLKIFAELLEEWDTSVFIIFYSTFYFIYYPQISALFLLQNVVLFFYSFHVISPSE